MMSVEVKVKQKGIIKKNLKISDVIFKDMGYGIMDINYRMQDRSTSEYTILYNKNKIGRGFEIKLNKQQIELCMSLPTSDDEIHFFYDYIKKICKLLHTNVFEREGEIISLDGIDDLIELDINTSKDALKNIKNDIEAGKFEDSVYLFGAYNPIALGEKELSIIENSPKKLGILLHELQSIDAYYAGVKIYKREDESLFGIYVLTEKVLSIFPFKPGLIMNHKMKINDYYVNFVYEDEIKGAIRYEDFMANIDITRNYDAEHFLISLSRQKMKKLLDKYAMNTSII